MAGGMEFQRAVWERFKAVTLPWLALQETQTQVQTGAEMDQLNVKIL